MRKIIQFTFLACILFSACEDYNSFEYPHYETNAIVTISSIDNLTTTGFSIHGMINRMGPGEIEDIYAVVTDNATNQLEYKYDKKNSPFTIDVDQLTLNSTYSIVCSVKIDDQIFSSSPTEVKTLEKNLEIIFLDNLDNELATQTYGSSKKYWPYLDQFPNFVNATGKGVKNKIEYNGYNVTCRNNFNSTGNDENFELKASGGNNILFSKIGGYINISSISLEPSDTDFMLTWWSAPNYNAEADNTDFKVFVSEDGINFTEIPAYERTSSKSWGLCSCFFSIVNPPQSIVLRFESNKEYIRIDDIQLKTTFYNDNFQKITFN